MDYFAGRRERRFSAHIRWCCERSRALLSRILGNGFPCSVVVASLCEFRCRIEENGEVGRACGDVGRLEGGEDIFRARERFADDAQVGDLATCSG